MKKLYKVLMITLLITAMLNMKYTVVNAASYDEEQIQNGEVSSFQPGDTLHFSDIVTVSFFDRNGVLLDTQTASEITVPDYELKTANFSGWLVGYSTSSEGRIKTLQCIAYILPPLTTTPVNVGEPVTFSFNESDLPLPHDYTYEWIAGGRAGGYNLEGTTNTTSFTITPDSPYYQDGFIVACRITTADGKHRIYTGEAQITLIPVETEENIENDIDNTNEEAIVPTPTTDNNDNTNTNTKNSATVNTADNTILSTHIWLLGASLVGILAGIKKRYQ